MSAVNTNLQSPSLYSKPALGFLGFLLCLFIDSFVAGFVLRPDLTLELRLA